MRVAVTALVLSIVAERAIEAQDTTLTRLLLEHRHPLTVESGRLAGDGGRMLVRDATDARYTLVGEEHGIAEVPGLVMALLSELRPAGYNTFAIEISPLQAQRLDGMTRRSTMRTELDSLLASWYTTIPFYTLAEERALLVSAMSASAGLPPMRIWGLDYDVSADRFYLDELVRLATPAGRESVRRARVMAETGFAGVLKNRNPGGLFAWSASDSVFNALRAAFGGNPPARAREIIDVFERTARINRAFLSGDGYGSNLSRSSFMRENLAKYLAASPADAGRPRVLFKFGGSHVMRGYNYTNTLDVGTAAAIDAESRSERSYHVLFVGGPGRQTARMNILAMQYEPRPGSEIDDANLAWLKPAVPDSGVVLFDLRAARAARAAYVRRPNRLTPMQDRFLHAYDAVVVVGGSTPGRALPLVVK